MNSFIATLSNLFYQGLHATGSDSDFADPTFPRNKEGPADQIFTPAPTPLFEDGPIPDLSFFLNPVVLCGALFILAVVVVLIIVMIKKKDVDE